MTELQAFEPEHVFGCGFPCNCGALDAAVHAFLHADPEKDAPNCFYAGGMTAEAVKCGRDDLLQDLLAWVSSE